MKQEFKFKDPEWLAMPDGEHYMCRVGVDMGGLMTYSHMTVPNDMYTTERIRAAVEADLVNLLWARLRGDA